MWRIPALYKLLLLLLLHSFNKIIIMELFPSLNISMYLFFFD